MRQEHRNDEVPQEVGGALIRRLLGQANCEDDAVADLLREAADYITTLRAKLEAAEGEVARLREDARRWRFVRGHLDKLYLYGGTELFGPSEERLDAAVDALGDNANA